MPEIAPMLPEVPEASKEPEIPKPHRNSLSGLPQYDPTEYGREKSRRTATKPHIDETGLVADVDGKEVVDSKGEMDEVDFDVAFCFHEAVHALSAIARDEPNVENAINGPESSDWKRAINEELAQIEKLRTWELVEAPDNANIVPCRWVLLHKRNAQGKIASYKAHLVAKGFRQQIGVDYTDTFAPTVRPATLRILLTLGAANGNNIIIEQADVKNTYLNAWMHEDEVVLMDIPKFYEMFHPLSEKFKRLAKSGKQVALRLKWPLYETKQGAHHWYEELKRILLSFGFKVSVADEATFYKVDADKFLVIAAATDDFTIVTNSRALSTKTKADLNRHFELVDLGDINWLLGVSVTRNLEDKTISLGQQAYVEQILTRFGLSDARPDVTPMEPSADYHFDSPSVSPTLLSSSEKTTYREMISERHG
jgi:hypothetical protein